MEYNTEILQHVLVIENFLITKAEDKDEDEDESIIPTSMADIKLQFFEITS